MMVVELPIIFIISKRPNIPPFKVGSTKQPMGRTVPLLNHVESSDIHFQQKPKHSMETLQTWTAALSSAQRLLLLLAVAVAAHALVRLIKTASSYAIRHSSERNYRKTVTLISLFSSSSIFVIYFAGVGIALSELGVPIAGYLASASIIGLAVGFGSQGLVQDIVSGLTSISSNIYDVGDMVEIGGQVGVVKNIGLRFLEIENPLGARVMVPNRLITNVINYKRGYIRCIADITLPEHDDNGLVDRLTLIANGVYEQFPGILVTKPTIEGIKQTSAGRRYLRIKFRIWPGRGAPIEQSFRQEVVQEVSKLETSYKEWMVAVYYEVELKIKPPKSKKPA